MEGGIIDDSTVQLQGANRAGFNPSFQDCTMFLAPSIVKGPSAAIALLQRSYSASWRHHGESA